MAIQALEKFRQSYPQYSDKSDSELATALADKYPEAYGFLPKMVERENVISTYNPITQLSARMAEERPNMLQAALEEGGKPASASAIGRLKQLGAFGLKGTAAVGQGIEGAFSAPTVAMQRGQFNPIDIAKTTFESATGQAPTELGDIIRNVGAPELVAQIGGLVSTSLLPGFKQAKQVARVTRRATNAIVSGIKNKAVRGVARVHLPLLARVEPEVVEHALVKKFSFIKPGETAKEVEEKLTKSVNKIGKAANYVKRRASRFQAKMLKQHGNDVVDVSVVVAKTRGVADKSNLYLKDAAGQLLTDDKGVIMLNNIPGNNKLQRIIGDIEVASKAQNGKLTINQVKGFQKRVRVLAGEERYKEVYAVASELENGLSKATHQIADVQKADKLYSTVMEVVKGSESKGIVGVEDLYKPTTQGRTAAEKYFKLEPKAKTSLQALEDMRLPAKKRFLEELKDSVAANEFKTYKPQAGISLLGLGASIAKPEMIPAVSAAVGLSSKRASGIIYKVLLGELKGSPAAKAVMNFLAQGFIDPAIIRAAREEVMRNTKE